MGLFDWLKPKSTGAAKAAPVKSSGPVDQTHSTPDVKPSEALLRHSKPGWLLHTESEEGEARASRIGGRPFMGENEIWPSCGDCKNPLSFIMQYDLEALADTGLDHGKGLLRFFYCEHEDCVGMGGWQAFDPQHHLSILQGDGACRDVPDGTKIHPASRVVRWEKIDDIPHWEDRPDALLDDEATPYYGHKFGGWPFWIQGAERPNCPDCNSKMDPIIQLDENHTRSFNFGGGIGHISQCTTHPDQLAFGWACG